jgi:hypothetical protein
LKYVSEISKNPLSAILTLFGTSESGNLIIKVVPLIFDPEVEALMNNKISFDERKNSMASK